MNIYCKQSPWTNPGLYEYFYIDLPTDLLALRRIISHQFLHFIDYGLKDYITLANKADEYDIRPLFEKFQGVVDDSAMYDARNVLPIMHGVCRDNALLFCSILRSRNILARLRGGFVTYVDSDLFLDGYCVQFFNEYARCWQLVDPKTVLVDGSDLSDTKLLNLDETLFISAPSAWLMYRQNQVNPLRFGSRFNRGVAAIANMVLRDFAAVNCRELLLWDLWGEMLNKTVNVVEVDFLADYLLAYEFDSEKLSSLYYDQPKFSVINPVHVCSPFSGKVSLEMVDGV